MKALAIACAFLLLSSSAQAMLFDINTFYYSDAFAPEGSTSTFATTTYDIRVGFALDKKSRFFVGWNYSGVTRNDQISGVNNQYTSTEMGPSFIWALNKERTWIFSFSYNLLSNGQYTANGASAEKWKGTTMKIFVGYTFEIAEYWHFGPTLNYYSANYNEKIINETTYSQSTNTRSLIYPALYIGHRF